MRPQRLHYLLLILLVAMLTLAFANADRWRTQVAFEIVIGLIVIAIVYDTHPRRDLRWIGIVLGTVVVATRGWLVASVGPEAHFSGPVAAILFFAFASYVLLRDVVRATDVTGDTIAAALCVYVLLGILWAFAYSAIEVAAPGSFAFPARAATDEPLVTSLVYFSFVTLTTLGYGDITPVASPARILAALQAIVGQFYVAVLVARLVGIHASNSLERRRRP